MKSSVLLLTSALLTWCETPSWTTSQNNTNEWQTVPSIQENCKNKVTDVILATVCNFEWLDSNEQEILLESMIQEYIKRPWIIDFKLKAGEQFYETLVSYIRDYFYFWKNSGYTYKAYIALQKQLGEYIDLNKHILEKSAPPKSHTIPFINDIPKIIISL